MRMGRHGTVSDCVEKLIYFSNVRLFFSYCYSAVVLRDVIVIHSFAFYLQLNMSSVAKLNKFEDEGVLRDLLNIVIDGSKNVGNDNLEDVSEFAKAQG